MKTAGLAFVKRLRSRLLIWEPVRSHDPIKLLLAKTDRERKRLVLDQIKKHDLGLSGWRMWHKNKSEIIDFHRKRNDVVPYSQV